MERFVSTCEQETKDIAKRFAQSLFSGSVVALIGDLGAGKTAFTKGVAEFFCATDDVSSPTFTIVNEYSGEKTIYHFDAYRLENVNTDDCDWLDDYFRGIPREIDFQTDPAGTPFQKLIWKFLLEIPYGKTVTYGDLARAAAKAMGKEKTSAQAVGQAVGRNPIAIIIPCHRCVGAKGKLTGYAYGLDRKAWLLKQEQELL